MDRGIEPMLGILKSNRSNENVFKYFKLLNNRRCTKNAREHLGKAEEQDRIITSLKNKRNEVAIKIAIKVYCPYTVLRLGG